MVRINLINPKYLTDQHLIAEYNEILMLIGHVKKHPKIHKQPKQYCLGTGHITFFKDKLVYIKQRHELIKKEMKKRNFKPTKTINLKQFRKELKNNYKPCTKNKTIIKQRLIQKINKKPKYYRYYKEHKPKSYLINLVKKAK